jgi:putative thioredoxin
MQPGNDRLIPAAAGAVDLSALRRPATTTGGGGGEQPTAPSAPGAIFEVTDANFTSEVVARSQRQIVVLDFWADWCQPCKQLSPILERLAGEAGGAWVLGKVDVDANPQLSQSFGVQSIPMVLAVAGGQMLDGFMGALPESQVRQWLDAILRAARQAFGPDYATARPGTEEEVAAPAEPAEPEPDPRYAAAEDALERGNLAAAEAAYRKVLDEAPADAQAQLGLGQVRLAQRLEGVDPAAVIAAADANPDDVPAQTLAADVELVSDTPEKAFNRLVDTVRRTAGDEREAARSHLVELFNLFPPDDPDVTKARRALGAALF